MKCFPLNIICVLLFVISSITNNVQGEHTHTHTQCQQYKELSGDCGGNDIKWIRDKSTTECINECNEDANSCAPNRVPGGRVPDWGGPGWGTNTQHKKNSNKNNLQCSQNSLH